MGDSTAELPGRVPDWTPSPGPLLWNRCRPVGRPRDPAGGWKNNLGEVEAGEGEGSSPGHTGSDRSVISIVIHSLLKCSEVSAAKRGERNYVLNSKPYWYIHGALACGCVLYYKYINMYLMWIWTHIKRDRFPGSPPYRFFLLTCLQLST